MNLIMAIGEVGLVLVVLACILVLTAVIYFVSRSRRAGAKPTGAHPYQQASQSSAFREPFGLEAEPCLVVGPPARPSLRLSYRGQISVSQSLELVLLIGIVDVTDGTPRPVLGTLADHRDEDTGEYRLKSLLGRLSPPGKRHPDWHRLGLVDLSTLQAPFAGLRKLRVYCAGVSAPLAGVIDPTQDYYHTCWANTTIEAFLPNKGYTELSQSRWVGAGLVVLAALAVSRDEGWRLDGVSSRVGEWMKRHARTQSGQYPEEADGLQRAMEAALEVGGRNSTPSDALIRQLVSLQQSNLNQQLLRLCLAIARDQGGMPPGRMVELARKLEIPDEAWVRLHAEGMESDDLDALALEVGLDPTWEPARARVFLRKEFAACNARSMLVRTSAERDAIQVRMGHIAKLTRRYG